MQRYGDEGVDSGGGGAGGGEGMQRYGDAGAKAAYSRS